MHMRFVKWDFITHAICELRLPVGEWCVCFALFPRQDDRKSLRWALYLLGTLALPALAFAGVDDDPLEGGVSPSEKYELVSPASR